ncbi:MAG: T9SS type A sorting domain-containing protein, partial [Melioribacteraceae bacterium]|nr:T9SS type A sorting domain-containing protein [Melioribacteraceae bacterium]
LFISTALFAAEAEIWMFIKNGTSWMSAQVDVYKAISEGGYYYYGGKKVPSYPDGENCNGRIDIGYEDYTSDPICSPLDYNSTYIIVVANQDYLIIDIGSSGGTPDVNIHYDYQSRSFWDSNNHGTVSLAEQGNNVPQYLFFNNNFPGGSISVYNELKTSLPFNTYELPGHNIPLTAVESSTPIEGYKRVWSTGNNPSVWLKTENGNQSLFPNPTNQTNSYSVTTYDDVTIQADQRLAKDITFSNQFPGIGLVGNHIVEIVEGNPHTETADATGQSNGIFFTFDHWSTGSDPYSRTQSFEYNDDASIQAIYSAKPMFNDVSYRFLQISAQPTGMHTGCIRLTWQEHPNSNVTWYAVYRKIAVNGTPQLLRTLVRGNTECIDGEFLYYGGEIMEALSYSVLAKYSYTNEWSEHTWLNAAGGDSGLPALWKKGNNNTYHAITEYAIGNFPNPFNPSAWISYQLPEAGVVSIKVYDMLGKEVAELVNEMKDMGIYNVQFNANDLASGIYVYTIRVDALSEESTGFIASKKMLLMK